MSLQQFWGSTQPYPLLLTRLRMDCFAVVENGHVVVFKRNKSILLMSDSVELVSFHPLARVFIPFTPWLFQISNEKDGKRNSVLINFSRPRSLLRELERCDVPITKAQNRIFVLLPPI